MNNVKKIDISCIPICVLVHYSMPFSSINSVSSVNTENLLK